MFRPATYEDAPFISELVGEFYSHVGAVYRGIPYDFETGVAAALAVIKNGICLVGPSSCAGAVLKPFDWNRAFIVAHVAFWYFRSAREMAIFDALAALCRDAGATHVYANSHFPQNNVGRFYASRDFLPAECGYFIALKGKKA